MKTFFLLFVVVLVGCSAAERAPKDPFTRCDDPRMLDQIFNSAGYAIEATQLLTEKRAFVEDSPFISDNKRVCRIEAVHVYKNGNSETLKWTVEQEFDVSGDLWYAFDYSDRVSMVMDHLGSETEKRFQKIIDDFEFPPEEDRIGWNARPDGYE